MKRILLFTCLTCFAWTITPVLVTAQDAHACSNATPKSRAKIERAHDMKRLLKNRKYVQVIEMGNKTDVVRMISTSTLERMRSRKGVILLRSLSLTDRKTLTLVAIANTRGKGIHPLAGRRAKKKQKQSPTTRRHAQLQWSAYVLEALASKKFKGSIVSKSRRGADALAAEAIVAADPSRGEQMLAILKELDAKQRIHDSATYTTYAQLLKKAGEDALSIKATEQAKAKRKTERSSARRKLQTSEVF